MQELIQGGSAFFLYIIPAALLCMIARKVLRIPDELFRKILHFVLLGAYIPVLSTFTTWWIAVLFIIGTILLLYPLLALLERIPAFASFLNQRREGEIKNSMILALSVMAVSISVCWGWLGDKYLVLASIYAWGVGDAFAALIGKQFGKHKIHLRGADPHKSMEGSLAMFVTSSVAVLIVMLLRGGLGTGACILISAAAAAMSTVVELYTKDGYDTITCPTAAMLVILPLIHLLGG